MCFGAIGNSEAPPIGDRVKKIPSVETQEDNLISLRESTHH